MEFKRLKPQDKSDRKITFELYDRISKKWKKRNIEVEPEFYNLLNEYLDKKELGKSNIIPQKLYNHIMDYYSDTYFIDRRRLEINFIKKGHILVDLR